MNGGAWFVASRIVDARRLTSSPSARDAPCDIKRVSDVQRPMNELARNAASFFVDAVTRVRGQKPFGRLPLLAGIAIAAGAAFAASFWIAESARAQSVAAPADASTYANPQAWLCRPGRRDACAVDQDATIVAADGTLSLERFHADPNPPIDCFYVYPTVSEQPGGNADLTIEAGHRRAAAQQFARFASRCRLFAPMYRQVTQRALRAAAGPHPIAIDKALGNRDVAAAWRYYLAHDNRGRGVVLIGHSQGAGVLTQLIKDEIDGKSIEANLVSAILMGTSLPAPKDAKVGRAFKHIPVCRSDSQIGCVIAFADFRANIPPPAGSLFVRAPDGTQSVCANPASLGGGAGALDAYLSSTLATILSEQIPHRAWTRPPRSIRTPFVKVPGLLSAECASNAHGSYLLVTVHPTPGGARVNDISGDLTADGRALPEWGLHLIDANLNMGNLIAIVGEETKTYLAGAHP
jgi:Protein of unknown function (DUF3089)